MADPRYKKLAEVLTGYSTALKKGDTVLFDITDTPESEAPFRWSRRAPAASAARC
jgi:hypothetical protein